MAGVNLSECYFKCAGQGELLNTTFNRVLTESAEKYADREAFVFCEDKTRITYKEIKIQADKVGAGLLSLGLCPGDRLVIWAPCSLEWLTLQYACIRAGILYTGLNPAYPPGEAVEILQKLNPHCIVTGARFKSGDAYSVLKKICPELETGEGSLNSKLFLELKHVIIPSATELHGVTQLKLLYTLGGDKEMEIIQKLEETILPSDPVTIQLTSGTTGCPKAVVLTHHHLINTCSLVAKRVALNDVDMPHRLCIPGLMFRCAIMMLGSLCSVMHGMTSVVPSKVPDAAKTLTAIAQEKCSCIFGNPPMLAGLVKSPDFEKFDLSSLTTAILGGSSCAYSLMKFVVNKLQLRQVSVGMPMTELGGIALATPTDCSLETKCDTIGLPLEHLEVKITSKGGETVAMGKTGELCIRGFATPSGYLDGGKTKTVIDQEGWFNTGDMVQMAATGYVSTMGRKKDVIIQGNDVIYPTTLEEQLVRHPGIVAIEVVGVPPVADNQQVCACVVKKEEVTEEDIREFCKEETIRIPDYVCFVESFPKTLTMKVRKSALAKEMAAKLHL